MPFFRSFPTILLGALALVIIAFGLVLSAGSASAQRPASPAAPLPSGGAAAPVASATCTPGPDYVFTQTTGSSIVPGTFNTGNSCDDCVTQITLPFAFNFYGVPYTRINAGSNGNIMFDSTATNFESKCLPTEDQGLSILAHWDDLTTSDNISPLLGIYTSVTGVAPNRIFNVEWRTAYISDLTHTQRANFEVRFFEGQTRFDVVYGQVDQGGSGASVGVQRNVNMPATQYECHVAGSIQSGLQLTFQQQTCGLPVNTPTPTSTPSACGVDANYVVSSSGGASIVPGTSLVPGSQADDAVANIRLPFNFRLYGQEFPAVNASTNGNLQFSSANPTFFNDTCLPSQFLNNAIAAHWDDLDTTSSITTTFTPGIYTSVTGIAPNRIFNIEWRSCIFANGSCNGAVNFEARLYEAGDQFDVIYGALDGAGSGATVGVQRGTGLRSTQYECNTGGLTPGQKLSFTLPACAGTPTPTPFCVPLSQVQQQIGLAAPGEPRLVRSPDGPSRAQLSAETPKGSNMPTSPASGFAPLGPISFLLDDGIREGSVGVGTDPLTQTAAIWLNRFTPGGFNLPLTLNNLSILWPEQTGSGTLVGKSATLLVYQDSDGDNNPSNATLLSQQSITITGTGTFINYPVNIQVSGSGDLYIGFSDTWANSGYAPRLFPAALDTTTPRVRSWVATMSTGAPPNLANLGANDTLGTTDALGVPGNFMIRAGATTANTCPSPTPTYTPGATTSTPTATGSPASTLTPTNTPQARIAGHLTWQSVAQPDPRNVQTATLTLCVGGSPQSNVVNIDASGNFTLTTSLPNGSYNWLVKGTHHLASSGNFTISGGVGPLEVGTMRGGDSIEDNLDNSQDFNNLKVNFGITTTDLRADFDFNGLVNASDFNILKSNFGTSGAQPNCP